MRLGKTLRKAMVQSRSNCRCAACGNRFALGFGQTCTRAARCRCTDRRRDEAARAIDLWRPSLDRRMPAGTRRDCSPAAVPRRPDGMPDAVLERQLPGCLPAILREPVEARWPPRVSSVLPPSFRVIVEVSRAARSPIATPVVLRWPVSRKRNDPFSLIVAGALAVVNWM